jgi:WD40 repeat protein
MDETLMASINLNLPSQLIVAGHWDDLASVLLDISFLEAKADAGHVFELAGDFTKAVNTMPVDHPQASLLKLIRCGMGADIQFIAEHPSTLFQCLWNQCWWHDCPAAANFYEGLNVDETIPNPPWHRSEPKLYLLMESWLKTKQTATPGFRWLRSLRPLPFPLNHSQHLVFRSNFAKLRALSFSNDGNHLLAWFSEFANGQIIDTWSRGWELSSGSEQRDSKRFGLPPDTTQSPDGKSCLKHESWKPLRLCNRITSATIKTFSTANDGEENFSTSAFSPDGSRVAGAAYGSEGGGDLRLWNKTGSQIFSISTIRQGPAYALAFSPDGSLLASGHSNGDIEVRATHFGRLLFRLKGHEGPVSALAFSADGRWIASGSWWDHTVRIWSSAAGNEISALTVKGHPDSIQEIVFSTDGNRLVTRSENQTTWLWDGTNSSPIVSLYHSTYIVLEGGGTKNSIFANQHRILQLSTEGIKIWNSLDGLKISSDPNVRFYWYDNIVFSPDGQHFILNSRGEFRIANITETNLLNVVTIDAKNFTCFAFSPDSRRIVSGSEDGIIRLWDVSRATVLSSFFGHEASVTSVAFSSNGTQIVSAAQDKTIRTWDIWTSDQLTMIQPEDPGVLSSNWSSEHGHQVIYGVKAVGFTADGQFITSLSISGTDFQSSNIVSRVWNPNTGTCVRTLKGVGSFYAVCSGTPWQAIIRTPEQVEIISEETDQVIAHYPATLETLRTHQSGRIWAGSYGNHLYHFFLEEGCPGALQGDK